MKIKLLKNKIYNYIMLNGKKNVCEKMFLKSFKILQKHTIKNQRDVLKLAIINAAPTIQMKQVKKKKRKTIKEFPFILKKKNRIGLSVKFILKSLQKNIKTKMEIAIFKELLLNANNKSSALKTKEINHKQALLKKKYVFFRWFF